MFIYERQLGFNYKQTQMAYPKNHTDNDCDKCQKKVGKKNLFKVPFIYKDCNDKTHKDEGEGYRQYYFCIDCKASEDRIRAKQNE